MSGPAAAEEVAAKNLDDLYVSSWEKLQNRSAARPLPLEVEEITSEWLTAALSIRAPGLMVNSSKVTRVRHGFTSIAHVEMELNEAGRKAGVPEMIVVKGGFTQYSRPYAYGYAMEAHGYRDLWPVLTLKMPTSYFVDIDLEARQSIIIMEDLNARGVKFGSGLTTIGYGLMRERLSQLARLHAQTWDSPELRPGGRFANVLKNGARMLRLHMEADGYIRLKNGEELARQSEFHQTPPFLSPEGWAEIWSVKMSQNAAASRYFRDLEWTRRAMAHIEKLNDELPNCILHGDTHLSNYFEEPDGTPGFFDAMPRREPAQMELAYTITTGLDPLDRRNWERSLIGHYVGELARYGVKTDFDEMAYYYALYLHQGYLWFIINDTVWQTPAFNTSHVSRFNAAMIDNNTRGLFDAAFAAK